MPICLSDNMTLFGIGKSVIQTDPVSFHLIYLNSLLKFSLRKPYMTGFAQAEDMPRTWQTA